VKKGYLQHEHNWIFDLRMVCFRIFLSVHYANFAEYTILLITGTNFIAPQRKERQKNMFLKFRNVL